MLSCLIAIHFSYSGSVAAGSGPGGWNFHLIFVHPATFAIVTIASCFSVAIAVVSQVHLFSSLSHCIGRHLRGIFFNKFYAISIYQFPPGIVEIDHQRLSAV